LVKSIIDIGTNTAHLLIGEVLGNKLSSTILKHREYTFLGEHGLKEIHKDPIQRLITALEIFVNLMYKYESKSVTIIATDALRSASNGCEIQRKIESITGSKPRIISGKTEANLIRKGVELSLTKIPKNYLIMDIGGGSVEFIHVINNQQTLLQSLPLGISRLHAMCKDKEVLDEVTIRLLRNHIKKTAVDVISSCQRNPLDLTLIGSAGTFEIFLPEGHLEDPMISRSNVDLDLVDKRFNEVIQMDMRDRKQVSWLPEVRSKYIIVALLLMKTIIDEIKPSRLLVSKYALKEGAIVSESSDIVPNF